MPAGEAMNVVLEFVEGERVGRNAGHVRNRRRQDGIDEDGVPIDVPEKGKIVVVDVVGQKTGAQRLHVGMAARDFRTNLRVHEIGHGDGRQDADDGDHDQKFN